MDAHQAQPSVLGGIEAIPITRLHPDIPDPSSKVVDGVVTLTWPYSIVNKSIAFILAEHDVRLRRDRGHLRVECHGAAATALENLGVGAGDGVRMSLEGVAWERNEANLRLPGTPLEWKLRFTNRLRMDIYRDESHQMETIDIDFSANEEHAPEPDIDLSVLFEPQQQVDPMLAFETPMRAPLVAKKTMPSLEQGEYASPAFLKRARVSYGSLFEDGFDIFHEEEKRNGGRSNKRRRKSRFSLNASWRYSSRSPSPEVEQSSDQESESPNEAMDGIETGETGQASESPLRPSMVDQGCQTQDLDYSPSRRVQVVAESRSTGALLQSTPVPLGRFGDARTPSNSPPALPFDRTIPTSKYRPEDADSAFRGARHATPDGGYDLDSDEYHSHIDATPIRPFTATSAPTPTSHQADAEAIGTADYPSLYHHHRHVFEPASMEIDPNLQFQSIDNHLHPHQPHHLHYHHQEHLTIPNGSWGAETSMATYPHLPEQAEASAANEIPDGSSVVRRPSFRRELESTDFDGLGQHAAESLGMQASDTAHDIGKRNSFGDEEDGENKDSGEEDLRRPEHDRRVYVPTYGNEEEESGDDEDGEDEENEDDEEDEDEDESFRIRRQSASEEHNVSILRHQGHQPQKVGDYDDESASEESEEEDDHHAHPRHRQMYESEDENDEGDDEGEYDDDQSSEDDYAGHDEEGESGGEGVQDEGGNGSLRSQARPNPTKPQEPVVISLLSDSEDEASDAEVDKKSEAENRQNHTDTKLIDKIRALIPKDEEKHKTQQEDVEMGGFSEDDLDTSEDDEDEDEEDEEVELEEDGEHGEDVYDEEENGEDVEFDDDDDQDSEDADISHTAAKTIPQYRSSREPGRRAGSDEELQETEDVQAVQTDANVVIGDAVTQSTSIEEEGGPVRVAEEASKLESYEVVSTPDVQIGPTDSDQSKAIAQHEERSRQSRSPEVTEAREAANESSLPDAEGVEPVNYASLVDAHVGHEMMAMDAEAEKAESPRLVMAETKADEEKMELEKAQDVVGREDVTMKDEVIEQSAEGLSSQDITGIEGDDNGQDVMMEENRDDETSKDKESWAEEIRAEEESQGRRDAHVQDDQTTKEVEVGRNEPKEAEEAEEVEEAEVAEEREEMKESVAVAWSKSEAAETFHAAPSPTSTQMGHFPAPTTEEKLTSVDCQEKAHQLPTPGETQTDEFIATAAETDAMLERPKEGGAERAEDEAVDEAEEQGEEEAEEKAEGEAEEEAEEEPQRVEEGEDDVAAKQQLMEEDAASQSRCFHSFDGASDEPPRKGRGERQELLITVQSLRSHCRRHRKSTSAESNEMMDPSIALARASPTKYCLVDDEMPNLVLRASRGRTYDADASVALARASTAGSGSNAGRKSSAPLGELKVTRRRSDGPDPSVLLARASPPPFKGRHSLAGPHVATRAMRRKSDEHGRSVQPGRVSAKDNQHRNMSPMSASGISPTKSLTSTRAGEGGRSPSVAGSSAVFDGTGAGTLKLQLLKNLRTSLPDCLPLRSLRTCLNKMTDMMAVATATPAQAHRPKHGPRDYMLEVVVTDPSTAPTGVNMAQIFRPHQSSLPVIQAGDVVLLRRVQVVSLQGRGFGVRACEVSAWAVFEKGDEEMLPQIKGPPVEVSDEEVEQARGLMRWWDEMDDKAMDKVKKASQVLSHAGKDGPR